MAEPNALEQYLSDLTTQHQQQLASLDQYLEADRADNAAEAAASEYDIRNTPINILSRQWGMDPAGAASDELSSRKRLLDYVQTNQRINDAVSIRDAAEQRGSLIDQFAQTQQRLQYLAKKGLTAMKGQAPELTDLRTEIKQSATIDANGQVVPTYMQVPKMNINRNRVETAELADFLQVPEEVVQKQLDQEHMESLRDENLQRDYEYAKQIHDEHNQDRIAALLKAKSESERAVIDFKWQEADRTVQAAEKFRSWPRQAVNEFLREPNIPDEMRMGIVLGQHLRVMDDKTKQAIFDEKNRSEANKRAFEYLMRDPALSIDLTRDPERTQALLSKVLENKALWFGEQRTIPRHYQFGWGTQEEAVNDIYNEGQPNDLLGQLSQQMLPSNMQPLASHQTRQDILEQLQQYQAGR